MNLNLDNSDLSENFDKLEIENINNKYLFQDSKIYKDNLIKENQQIIQSLSNINQEIQFKDNLISDLKDIYNNLLFENYQLKNHLTKDNDEEKSKRSLFIEELGFSIDKEDIINLKK